MNLIYFVALTFAGFAHAGGFNCTYTIQYDIYPGQEHNINEATISALQKCAGKMPCGDKQSQFTAASDHHSWVRFEEVLRDEALCIHKIQQSCRIIRKGILKKKTVTGNFTGKAPRTFECLEGAKLIELTAQGAPAPKSAVTTDPVIPAAK